MRKIVLTGMLLFLMPACAHFQPAIVAVAKDLAECALDDQTLVETAIRSGGTAWIGAILGAVQCLPKVIADIRAAEAAPAVTADASGTVPAPKLSKGAKRRLLVAEGFSRLFQLKAAP